MTGTFVAPAEDVSKGTWIRTALFFALFDWGFPRTIAEILNALRISLGSWVDIVLSTSVGFLFSVLFCSMTFMMRYQTNEQIRRQLTVLAIAVFNAFQVLSLALIALVALKTARWGAALGVAIAQGFASLILAPVGVEVAFRRFGRKSRARSAQLNGEPS